jgi:ribose-phosphate pyrophosphokinase
MVEDLLVVGCVSDNPFVQDIIQHMQQQEDYSDIISLKSFLNTEFCPRFLVDESSWENIGNKLEGKRVLIVSSSYGTVSRNDLSMRNCLIARAAKDNGAEQVILLEPDLHYSAQDRGPRKEHGLVGFRRDLADFKKFDGQPFSSRLYADLLKQSGVDGVVTVHNHSCSVESIFMDRFSGEFHNLVPSDVYSNYMIESDVVDYDNLVICAPDKGAVPFAEDIQEHLGSDKVPLVRMIKARLGSNRMLKKSFELKITKCQRPLEKSKRALVV